MDSKNKKDGQISNLFSLILTALVVVSIVAIISAAIAGVVPNRTSNVLNVVQKAFQTSSNLQFTLNKNDKLLIGYVGGGYCDTKVIPSGMTPFCDRRLCFCLMSKISDGNEPTQCSSIDELDTYDFSSISSASSKDKYCALLEGKNTYQFQFPLQDGSGTFDIHKIG